jgi:hypothetical protein
VDHPLKKLAIDFHRSGVQFQRRDVLQENRFAVSGRQDNVLDVGQIIPVFFCEPGANVIFIPILGIGIDDGIRLSVAVE